MAKGHLSEDTINFIVTAESDQLQQEIHKSILTGTDTCHGWAKVGDSVEMSKKV